MRYNTLDTTTTSQCGTCDTTSDYTLCNNSNTTTTTAVSTNSSSNRCRVTNHNHEFSAVTDYERDNSCKVHNHSISGSTGPAIRSGQTHVHRIEEYTDTSGTHMHQVCDTTGPAIYLSNGKHIHIIQGETSMSESHAHDYYFVTQVQDPSNVPSVCDC